ncbi:MAG: glycosyltransferase [Bacteroidia bacterium]|nr:glycosyltransferase [Bacteroidia bacterium]
MSEFPKGIFIGMQDLCSTIDEMRMVFERRGAKVFTAVHEQNKLFDQSKVDYNIREQSKKYYSSLAFKLKHRIFGENGELRVRRKLLRKAIKSNDVFIMYHPSIYSDYSDLAQIKAAGKKLICLVFGDDVRWYNAMRQWHEKRNIPPMEYEEGYVDTLSVDKWVGYLRQVERYADVIVMHPDTAHMALRPYMHYYMQLDTSKFMPGRGQRKERPVVSHAPSNNKVKGTRYVLEAVKELKEEGFDFEFRLMEKVPYDKVYDFYKDVDIMIVQLLAHGGGKQSYELLSCGKVVISRMQYEDYLPHIKEECPIIDADTRNIKEVLGNAILDYSKRVELAGKGRDYVLKYHDVNTFCNRIMNALSDTDHSPDYKPSFFREEYIPAENEVDDLNKWNRFVSDCSWYKKYVKPGERSGLKF